MPKLNVDLRGLVNFGKMSGGYFFTTIFNNAIPFLVLPILTRYLEPAEYGNVALFNFYLALSNAITGSSAPAIISKHFFDKEKKYTAKLVGNTITVIFLFSLLSLLLILIFYSTLKKYLELDLLWMLMIPLSSFAWVVFNLGLTVIRNSHNIISFSKHQIGNTLLNFGISVFLVAVLLWGWKGRLWGIIISYLISALIMIVYLKSTGYLKFSISKHFIRKILNIILPLVPNSLQSVTISQIGIFFIQFYYSKELLGIYSVGFQISFAVRLLVTAFSLSWGPFLYQQLAKGKKSDRTYISRMYIVMAGVVFIGMITINIFADLILRIMTTEEYYHAAEFIPYFTMGFFFFGLYIFFMPILIKYEKQKFISIISFINMFIMIVLNIVLSDIFGYLGIAYAFTLTYFLMFIMLAWKTQRTFPLPWLKAIKIWK